MELAQLPEKPKVITLLPRMPQKIQLGSVTSSPLMQRRLMSKGAWNSQDFSAFTIEEEEEDESPSSVHILGPARRAEGVKAQGGDMPGVKSHARSAELPKQRKAVTMDVLPPMRTMPTMATRTMTMDDLEEIEVGSIPDSDSEQSSPVSVASSLDTPVPEESWPPSASHSKSSLSLSSIRTMASMQDLTTSSKRGAAKRGAATLGALPEMRAWMHAVPSKVSGSGDLPLAAKRPSVPSAASTVGTGSVPASMGTAKASVSGSLRNLEPHSAPKIPLKIPDPPKSAGKKQAWA